MREQPVFGVCGYPLNFLKDARWHSRADVFAYLKTLGLSCFELPWTYGTASKGKVAKEYRKKIKESGVVVTLLGPQDMNFTSSSKRVLEHSKKQLERTFALAVSLGIPVVRLTLGNNIVKEERRQEIIELIVQELRSLRKKKKYHSLCVYLTPGRRKREFGSLTDLFEICNQVSFCYPCLHLSYFHVQLGQIFTSSKKLKQFVEEVNAKFKEDLSYCPYLICYPLVYEDGKIIPKTFGELKKGQISLFDNNETYFPKLGDIVGSILGTNAYVFSQTKDRMEIGAMQLRDHYFYQKGKLE